MLKVAYLEDDPAQSGMITAWLEEAGIRFVHCDNGLSLLNTMQKEPFDLALLDWEVPSLSGTDLVQQIRTKIDKSMPIIFATQRDDENSIVTALSAGADDYMIKPIRQRELVARITALARRAGVVKADKQLLTCGPYEIDMDNQQIRVDGELANLTGKDFELACYLFQNIGKLMSREHLLEHIWGVSAAIESRTVDVHVSRIRRSLKIKPEMGFLIKTVYQHGYRLEEVES